MSSEDDSSLFVTVLVTSEPTVMGSQALMPMPKQLFSLLKPMSGEIVGLRLISESSPLSLESVLALEELELVLVLGVLSTVVSFVLESTVIGSHTEMPIPRHELSFSRLSPRSTSGLRSIKLRLLSARNVGRLWAAPAKERTR